MVLLISRLPNLRDVVVSWGGGAVTNTSYSDSMLRDDIVNMASDSITNARIIGGITTAMRMLNKVNSFCIINRVFGGTSLVGFDPKTDLWTRILSKISNEEARATQLYRLLREKPDVVIGGMRSASSIS